MINVHISNPEKDCAVIIFHGLFMSSSVMKRMARFFSNRGYTVYNVTYKSRDISVEHIIDTIKPIFNQHLVVHAIGHSLGGLIIRHMFERTKPTHMGCVFTVGTPHKGASIAKYFYNSVFRWVLGNAPNHGLLDTLEPHWKHKQPMYNVIGTKHIGPLTLLPPLKGMKGDGTVLIEEAMLDGVKETKYFNVSHTLLIYSTRVFRYIFIKMKKEEKEILSTLIS